MVLWQFKSQYSIESIIRTRFAFFPVIDVYRRVIWLEPYWVCTDTCFEGMRCRTKDFSSKRKFYSALLNREVPER